MLHRASVVPLRLSLSSALKVQSVCTFSTNPTAPRIRTIDALLSSTSAASSAAKAVQVDGFVQSVRRQKRVAFLALSDGSTLQPLQVVLTPEQADTLSSGIAVRVSGTWASSPAGKEQSHELQAEHVAILGSHDSTTYPIQKKYQSAEFLRTVPHLRSRLPMNALLLRLRSQVISSLTSFFASQDFVQTHTPIITSSDCEGAGEVFSVASSHGPQPSGTATTHFFQSPKYLTVSAQLHLEALAQSVSRVWTLSPTFRAEKSDTPRHLSEFYMLEAEMCFVDDLNVVMTLIEEMLGSVASALQQSRLGADLLRATINRSGAGEEKLGDLPQLEARWQGLAKPNWPRITYKKAVEALQAATQNGVKFHFSPVFGASLQAEHEKYLAKSIGKGQPIFVTDYPRDIKAFYMPQSNQDVQSDTGDDTVACFDLLVPDLCELAGGSMREHNQDALLEAMQRKGILPNASQLESPALEVPAELEASRNDSLQWYIDLRRYGSVPHGGFGLGFDRLLSYLSGTGSVRDVVTFPRWYGRCDC